jgi:hypothetical protein
MHFTNTLLIVLTSALATSATNVHNQFGVNGDIQDRVGTVQGLPNGGSVAIGGGWGFFWVDASACHGGANSGVLQWPADFGVRFLIYSLE